MTNVHEATSGPGRTAADDAVAASGRLATELSGLAAALAPERVPGPRVREVSAALTVVERQARGLRLVLRKAAADTGDWKVEGHRSAADQVARAEGISVGQAKAEIEASGRLAGMPRAREAVASGEISPEAATVVAEGVAADAAAESSLVRSARGGDLRATRRKAQDVIARADERSGERAQRIRDRRALRAWVSIDGEGHGVWNIPAESHMRVMAALAPYRAAAFTAARASGERLSDEQLMADALDMLARDTLLDHDAEQDHAAGPAPTAVPVPDEPDLFADTDDAGPPAPPAPPQPTGPAPKRHRRAPAQVHVLVDLDALRRGFAEDGETCEVHGIGPVPVALARHLMTDAILRLVVTGTDVTKVTSQRRYVPEAVRRALFARDKGCCVVCGADRFLELHHFQTDFAHGGATEYQNLAHVCTRDHALMTQCGWTLHHTDDGWQMRPPAHGDDPP